MAVATATYQEKTDEQKAITEMVRQFVDNEIIPVAEEFDHEDKFPEAIVEHMKELGLFGVTIPEEYGGMGLDMTTYAMIVEELSRGWISISGVVNTHFIGSYLLMKFGTDEQRDLYLPRMATGEVRGAFSLSEPEVGSDVQGIKSTATEVDGGWEINGQKMWVTNGLRSGLVFVLVKTDPKADPPYRGMTCFICEKEPGRRPEVPWADDPAEDQEDGLQGRRVDGARFRRLQGRRRPRPWRSRRHRRGLQADDGRARARPCQRRRARRRRSPALPRAGAALQRRSARPSASRSPSTRRSPSSSPRWATRVEAARLLTMKAARMKDAGQRSDIEAGMAKLFASEAAKENAEEALRIHGGYGYSKEYEIERIYRDAPLLLIGEGTSEIQKMVIGRKLLERNKI